ncbi:YbaN family protein [Anaerosolibacter sp.]|uniref:YbaN family protein n=1 Tax=Anaerosolibacter sp. TaxID=1872527 RepID=UPI0039F0C6F8
MDKLIKGVLIVIGTLSMVLGFIGIFLPVLPTTPFLILASICYIRSSEKLHRWLMNHKLFGECIRNYQEKKGIPCKVKIFAIGSLWLSIGYSALFIIPVTMIKVLMFGIAAGVTIHILSFKTLE